MKTGARLLLAAVVVGGCAGTVIGLRTASAPEATAGKDASPNIPDWVVEHDIMTSAGGGFTKVAWSSDGKQLAAYVSAGDWISDASN